MVYRNHCVLPDSITPSQQTNKTSQDSYFPKVLFLHEKKNKFNEDGSITQSKNVGLNHFFRFLLQAQVVEAHKLCPKPDSMGILLAEGLKV